MTAESVAHFERRLQIHRRTNSEVPESGQRESLARHIGGESAIEELRSGQTAPLHANAIANAEVAGLQMIERDDNPRIATAIVAGPHLANILHDSSKHNSAPNSDVAGKNHAFCLRPTE
jgi:hypothetical protein